MAARVKVLDDELEVVGHGRLQFYGELGEEDDPSAREYLFVGTEEGAGPASLSSLRQALLKWRSRSGGDATLPVNVVLSSAPESEFTLGGQLVGSSVLRLEGERLLVQFWPRQQAELAPVQRLLAPIVKRHRASPDDLEVSEFGTVTVAWPTRGRTVADALDFHEEARPLLAAADGGEIARSTVLDLLRGGNWEVLKGQPESDWLEAKGEPYDHLGENWKYELAKDVAAFANSPDGGMILLGITTKNRRGDDIIEGRQEFELSRAGRQQYRKHIFEHVYPRVLGLEVEHIPGPEKSRGFVAITIPPQAEADLPFLVQGVLLRGKTLGTHVLLPVRDKAHTAFMDAKALHAHLRVGRQTAAESDG